ncbi:aldose 1-epimerase family protein [Bacteroidota bacterium]
MEKPNKIVENISITSETIKLEFSTAGAELISAVHLGNRQEFIWTGEAAVWPRHTPVLFPFVGKSASNTIRLNNKSWPMSQHGFARDQVFEINELYTDLVSFSLVGNAEKYPNFPFPFLFRISYHLEGDKLTITYSITNTGDEDLHCSVGAHPGFLLPVASLDHFSIWFEKDGSGEVSFLKDGLISGEKRRLDFPNNTLPLSSELFKDDALVFENLESRKILLAKNSGDYGIEMEYPDFPYLGIWAKYPNESFVCLEPWHGLADEYNFTGDFSQRKGMMCLPPESTKELSYSIRFLTKV